MKNPRWRAIGIVRVVEMHPEEELFLIILAQPIERDIGHNVAGAFHFIEIRFLQAVEIEMVVVEIESMIQAKARIEDGRTDDGASRIPVLLQHRSQRCLSRIELIRSKIMHAAECGIRPGEDHGV